MSNGQFHIVCVDDDKDVLDTICDSVEDFGHRVKRFTNVEEAVSHIKKEKHHILMILSDLRMDNINGFEFKKQLKGTCEEIPFIVITGYWTKEMSADAMELGIDAFIEKPISQEILKEHIDKFIDLRNEVLNDEKEMVEGFLEEASPMLDEIEELILDLEENPHSDQTLSIYFRLLHTIKGTASCVGLTTLGSYTHSYEDFIGAIRSKTIPSNTRTINVLLEGLDDLKKHFKDIQKHGSDSYLDIQDSMTKFEIHRFESSEDTSISVETNKEDDAQENNVKKADDKMVIPMDLLNSFMEESGELTVIRNSILKTVKKIESKFRGDKEVELLNELLDGMYTVTSNIQGKITEMRKVSLDKTFRPFKRLVRDLSKKLSKEVDLEVIGEEISVDSIIAKLYNNTLIHLLRNSLDHGLENPGDRIAAGKKPEGKLKISILEKGEEIILEIEDDGNGIDPQQIRAMALKKGLYTESELNSMSELEIINIIFTSGFSTATEVSDLSGRGVGMDMVRSSFEDMGGSVYVKSELGKGSIFILSVPVPKSVLIINTLNVRINKNLFLFHMDEVSEVIRFENESDNSKMYSVDGKLLLNHNESMIELVPLTDILGLDEWNSKNTVYNIVVLKAGKSRIGILVDEIYEFEEVVARKISDQIHSHQLFHGASLIGSGDIAMILSSEGIAKQLGISIETESSRDLLLDQSTDDEEVAEITEFMLFKYNPQEYLCIELDDVERLEKFAMDRIERVGDNYIVRYLDKVLPIIEPSSIVGLSESNQMKNLDKSEKDLLEVIVVNISGEKLGIIVHELDEIKGCSEQINRDTIVNNGLKGSVYINDSTISVLDLNYLLGCFKKRKYTLTAGNKEDKLAA